MRFPGESDAYRTARDRLLEAETGLRRQVEAVAELRRQLPLGGLVPQVLVRRDGEIRHFYGIEKSGPAGPDQDDRHIDLMWPLWSALDLTPAGRGDWRPARIPKAGAARLASVDR